MKPPVIAALGDSITAGSALVHGETNWTELLAGRFSAKVVNAGIGGNTAGEGLARMERDALAASPDIVLIEFGMNDHVICDAAGHPRTPLPAFRDALRTMIARCRDAGACPVLVTPNRIIEEYYYERHPKEWYLPLGGAQAQLALYCETIRETAADCAVPLADVHLLCGRYELPSLLRTPGQGNFRDGVHPYGAGIVLYADVIGRVLEHEVLPELMRSETDA